MCTRATCRPCWQVEFSGAGGAWEPAFPVGSGRGRGRQSGSAFEGQHGSSCSRGSEGHTPDGERQASRSRSLPSTGLGPHVGSQGRKGRSRFPTQGQLNEVCPCGYRPGRRSASWPAPDVWGGAWKAVGGPELPLCLDGWLLPA